MKKLFTILALLLLAASAVNAQCSPCFCCVVTAGAGSGSSNYTIEKVVRLNPSNPYETAAQQPASPKWNLLSATDAQVAAIGGYVNNSLLDETGTVAAGWSVTNATAFQQTTGSAPTPTSVSSAPANSGLYPDAIIAYGWVMPAAGDMIIRLSGLSSAKSYQVHLLANDEPWKNSVITASVGAQSSAAINANNNYGASTDNEYNATYVCHVKNAHTNSSGVLDITIHSSNANNPNIVAIVIQQTNIDNPN